MTARRRKKSIRMRGKTTHGYGAKKKHRGAGSRGGRGMAGSGKRAHQKKPTILKEYGPSYFGKHGFKRPQRTNKKEISLNLSYLEEHAEKIAKRENDIYVFDAAQAGYTKILGGGHLTKKFKITCKKFSKKALAKIQEAKGEAIQCP